MVCGVARRTVGVVGLEFVGFAVSEDGVVVSERAGFGEDHLRDGVAARGSRHASHAATHRLNGVRVSDPFELDDGLLDGAEGAPHSPMRSHRRSHLVEHPKGKLEETLSGSGKVWKLPFWKRRSAVRHDRSASLE